jgi:hypothetical protein
VTPGPIASDGSLVSARLELQRIATHVLARRRHEVTGRFGLRAAPGGFATPLFGADEEVLRVAGTALVRERARDARSVSINGASLRALAEFAGTDLGSPFEVGHDTPALGDTEAPIAVDASAAAAIAGWFDLGWRALDVVLLEVGERAAASRIQLWPEHFDAACSVAVGPGDADRCNLGVSPGDESSAEPYLYVGPWGADRPGDEAYWNAPFGAVLRASEVMAAPDPLATAVGFLRRGVMLQTGAS